MTLPTHRSFAALALAAAAVALSGCPGKDSGGATCSVASEKASVLAATRDWYLYPDLLPSPLPSAANYPTAGALLDALTATAQAQGKDRGWSFLETKQQAQQFFGDGQTIGYGLGLLVTGTAPNEQLFVREAVAGGAAAAAGFQRGDEILAVGTSDATLQAVGPLLAPATSADPTLSSVLSSSVVATTRVFQVKPAGSATVVERTVTTRVYDLDPVPVIAAGGGGTNRWAILTAGDGTKVGYLLLRTFISTAQTPLQAAFAEFQAAGVTNVVLDFRYNGGGLVSIAELIANLLGGGQTTTDTMFAMRNNPAHSSQDVVRNFAPQVQSITPTRIAFIMTGASASASELVASALAPHADVHIVGAQSYGKPVGQTPFDLQTCDSLLFLISFRLLNSAGQGDYFGGLPDPATGIGGTLCARDDDLGHLPGDPAEAMTFAAVEVAATGTCPAPAAAPAGAAAKLSLPAARTRAPAAEAPTLAQRDMPGLY